MKYSTISTGSLGNEKKSTLTIYADMDVQKVGSTEPDMASLRGELEMVQKALKLQTKRCRQLVAEYTRRLQEKEVQYRTEKALRDDQLAKVLRALLIFEARLKQEQKFISHQLSEKDYIIKKQSSDIKKLLCNQYCKNCNQFYVGSPVLESLDSSSEYVATDYQDYQSSNFESLDSSTETYASVSEKGYNKSESPDHDEKSEDSNKNIFVKNKNKDSMGRRSKKHQHRKSIGTYFEVLKLRNDSLSPCSNEDNTSNDYDNLESLPSEAVSERIVQVSDSIQNLLDHQPEAEEESSVNSFSECNNTVIDKEVNEVKVSKITESIPVFEGDGEGNDNWYASASDQEDEDHRNIYRNNPVLECMNQILLQNINDNLNSPPKTPNVERKKKVKFNDEEVEVEAELTKENLREKQEEHHDYYETPIQKTPNFYETPQSIYSNDYEQILSKCNESFGSNKTEDKNHFYVDMDSKSEEEKDAKIVRKSKILRTPPALPPKPANLVSKYKIQNLPKAEVKDKASDTNSEEPDYCSISELNLPQNKTVSFKKINVVAEINSPNSQDVLNKIEKANSFNKTEPSVSSDYDPVVVNDSIPSLVVKKCIEKINIQTAKQTTIKSEVKSPKKVEDIPKLPQVSEIIIPDETEEKEERISQDNYVKNNSQILKLKNRETPRRPIIIGSSVSSLITGFNNQQLLRDIQKKPERNKLNKTLFSSFENLQNSEKQEEIKNQTSEPKFDNFDLSQNFEEFKLDDCEIEEYSVEDISFKEEIPPDYSEIKEEPEEKKVEVIRAISDSIMPSLNRASVELLKKQLELQKNKETKKNEVTYEHFLECTGLSSKSILTPSRLLSNHKSMLKPKDVKLRSKVKAGNLIERHSTGGMKYWSEPYI